jgi:RimJ/RimL family protein N-acetyltransferase
MSVTLRRARPDDVDFLVDLLNDDEVQPFLAVVRPKDADGVRALVERSEAEPGLFGLFVIEADGEPAGTVDYELVNRRSSIANVGGLAVHPRFRGRGVGVEAAQRLQRHLVFELGIHRLQMEIYGFNERAIAHAERAGWIREGVRRRAYRRDDDWVDGVLFGLTREDLEEPSVPSGSAPPAPSCHGTSATGQSAA